MFPDGKVLIAEQSAELQEGQRSLKTPGDSIKGGARGVGEAHRKPWSPIRTGAPQPSGAIGRSQWVRRAGSGAAFALDPGNGRRWLSPIPIGRGGPCERGSSGIGPWIPGHSSRQSHANPESPWDRWKWRGRTKVRTQCTRACSPEHGPVWPGRP